MRKDLLVIGEVYHIFNKSIAGYTIFNEDRELLRFFNTIRYYQREDTSINFSKFFKMIEVKKYLFNNSSVLNNKKLVEIIAYCIMPTHFHLILKQLLEDGISIFMNNIQNSYSRYFNIKHNRKGPLWEGRFKSVLVRTEEQLLHLTRYVHLNPVTVSLVNLPEEWRVSSYREYISEEDKDNRICGYEDILDIEPVFYKSFVEDRISYQRELARMKDLLFD